MHGFVESINRLIVRDEVGSCDLPAGMPTTHPEWYARLAERAGWHAVETGRAIRQALKDKQTLKDER